LEKFHTLTTSFSTHALNYSGWQSAPALGLIPLDPQELNTGQHCTTKYRKTNITGQHNIVKALVKEKQEQLIILICLFLLLFISFI
jgi:hypothetical protein